jgi:hypothetical protein
MQRCIAAFLPFAAFAVATDNAMATPAEARTSTTREASVMRICGSCCPSESERDQKALAAPLIGPANPARHVKAANEPRDAVSPIAETIAGKGT